MILVKRTGNTIVYQFAVNRFIKFCVNPTITFTELNYDAIENFIQKLVNQGMKQNSKGNLRP